MVLSNVFDSGPFRVTAGTLRSSRLVKLVFSPCNETSDVNVFESREVTEKIKKTNTEITHKIQQ